MSYLRNPEARGQYAPHSLFEYGLSYLLSSIDDQVLWARNFSNARVSGRDVLTLVIPPKVAFSDTNMKYRFGFEKLIHRGQLTLQHSSGWAGFTSNVIHFPTHDCGVIDLSNFGGIHPINAP